MARHTQRRLAVVSGEGGGSRTTEDDLAKREKGKRGEMGGSMGRNEDKLKNSWGLPEKGQLESLGPWGE